MNFGGFGEFSELLAYLYTVVVRISFVWSRDHKHGRVRACFSIEKVTFCLLSASIYEPQNKKFA